MQKQSGISLMEILITLVIISGGLMLCLLDDLHRQAQRQQYHAYTAQREARLNQSEFP